MGRLAAARHVGNREVDLDAPGRSRRWPPHGLVGVSGAAAAEPPAPHRCFQADRYGEMPTCTWDGTRWTRSYDGAGAAGASTGPGSGFGALVVLMLLGGMAVTVWKLSTARRMAHDAGMSTRDATAMALLSDDGLEATYLASNLRGPSRPGPAPSPAPSPRHRSRTACASSRSCASRA